MSLISGIENFYASEGYVTVSFEFFCLTGPKKFVGEPFCAEFQKSSSSQQVLVKKGGVSIFSAENFLSHSAENFRSGTLPCCVSENFRERKRLWIRRGEYQDFPSKVFCLTMLKIFVGEPFNVSLVSGIENF